MLRENIQRLHNTNKIKFDADHNKYYFVDVDEKLSDQTLDEDEFTKMFLEVVGCEDHIDSMLEYDDNTDNVVIVHKMYLSEEDEKVYQDILNNK